MRGAFDEIATETVVMHIARLPYCGNGEAKCDCADGVNAHTTHAGHLQIQQTRCGQQDVAGSIDERTEIRIAIHVYERCRCRMSHVLTPA